MKYLKSFLLLLAVVFLCGFNITKPKVLVYGDSISIGYTPFVVEALKNKSDVIHNPGNGKYSAFGLKQLDEWLGDTQWDIIQFNWGLWGLCYRHHPDSPDSKDKINGVLTSTLDDYQKNMEALVVRLKETGAKLIFVTTTFVPDNEAGRHAEDVKIFNASALKVMKKHGVTVNDLYKTSRKVHPKYGKGDKDVHYIDEGYKRLSKQIKKVIKKELKKIQPHTK